MLSLSTLDFSNTSYHFLGHFTFRVFCLKSCLVQWKGLSDILGDILIHSLEAKMMATEYISAWYICRNTVWIEHQRGPFFPSLFTPQDVNNSRRKPKYPEGTTRTCRAPGRDGTQDLLEATVLTNAPPCCPETHHPPPCETQQETADLSTKVRRTTKKSL